ncbi:type II and III secretion system protein [Fibrobacter succinogenes subsp. succinogenes S85]|uniref:Type II and III secretion system protein n=1 Tax=Fibrobacter succinogenes (strain ATCC 19169 / S85) TaxID=59374 RepID=A0ABN3YU71_FIBSS|nr:secretin N-terminal domain-containing protein [Fibrobacter succinogenes]ACX74151.1 type II and III secretion system protein [Fibrobacter succinogenes subsp. succinogenes S85]
MLLRILGISLLTLLLSSSVAGARSVEKPKSVRTSPGAVTLDFVDVSLAEVARTLSLAYGTSILTDDAGDVRVTFHLEGVSLFEGLTSLCASHGLDLVLEGRVYHIRRARVQNGTIALTDSGVVIDVKNMNVREFVKEFGLNTGVNVLADYDVDGVVSGNLRRMVPEMAFRVLMESNGFKVRGERGCLRVSRAKTGNALNGSSDGAEVSVERAGDLYSVDLQSVSLKAVLKAIAEEAGLNLAVYGDLNETVQMSFKDVSLPELLASLFRGSAFTFRLDSSSLWVSEEGAKALADVRVFSLKHVSPEKAMAQLSKFMKGSELNVSEYREQNALVLGGSPRAIARAEELLKMVDVPQMQVTLACVIVEFRKGRSFAIGVRSGATRNVGERDIQARGFFDFLGKDISKSGAFGKIGILPDRFELELSSMEENNEAKVLARPRVTTLNGNKAELNVTNTVYYLVSQVSADGYPITDYRSFNDGISLELTPTMTQDGLITLSVSPEIKTAGRSTGDGPRDISSRNMKTTVVLRDGETLCLGGLIRKNKTEVRSAVPFLGSIPILGRLFSYTSEEEDESELAIFITPSVDVRRENGSASLQTRGKIDGKL